MSIQIMSRVVLAAALTFGAAGCQKADDAVVTKLDEISKKLDKLDTIEEKLAGGGAPGAARPQAPQPRGPQPGSPDPGAVYSVPIEGAPYAGPKNAKVTIVKGFEFACPFCQRVIPTLDQIEKDYGDDVKVVYKNYVVHPQTATTPALASCAAHKQGKYKEMAALIWEKGFNANRNLGADNMEAIAKELGLDMNRFKADMNGDACKKEVQTDQAQLAAVGTRGTPAFYINGRFLSGAQPIDRFKSIIDEELNKANERIKKGEATVDNYYAKFVVQAGKKKL
jgi:protein-disulfide isomerase